MPDHRWKIKILSRIFPLLFVPFACTGIHTNQVVRTPFPSVSTITEFSEIPASSENNSTPELISSDQGLPSDTEENFTQSHLVSQTEISPIVSHLTPSPLPPDFWMTLPVIPVVSQRAREIYHEGLELGRDLHVFSKVGDCQSIATYFLSYFDQPGLYDLGPYSSLQDTLDWYRGSFSRESLAVKGGFNAAAILSPLRSNPTKCNPDENPIACEYRINNPSLSIISLEEWWAGHPENYEKYMRQIIEYSIEQGVLPIIATKADNLEGNHLINQTIFKLATEYEIPLWNFWAAVQPLENNGLITKDSTGSVDMFHLTHSDRYYFYDDPSARQSGWSVRNLTALQVIDAVRRSLSDNP